MNEKCAEDRGNFLEGHAPRPPTPTPKKDAAFGHNDICGRSPLTFWLKAFLGLKGKIGWLRPYHGKRDQRGGITDQKGGIWGHSPRIRDHNPWNRDQHFFRGGRGGSGIQLYCFSRIRGQFLEGPLSLQSCSLHMFLLRTKFPFMQSFMPIYYFASPKSFQDFRETGPRDQNLSRFWGQKWDQR